MITPLFNYADSGYFLIDAGKKLASQLRHIPGYMKQAVDLFQNPTTKATIVVGQLSCGVRSIATLRNKVALTDRLQLVGYGAFLADAVKLSYLSQPAVEVVSNIGYVVGYSFFLIGLIKAVPTPNETSLGRTSRFIAKAQYGAATISSAVMAINGYASSLVPARVMLVATGAGYLATGLVVAGLTLSAYQSYRNYRTKV